MATATKAVEAADVVSDVKDLVEQSEVLVEDSARWIVSNPKVLVLGAILSGAVVGSALTYMVVSKRLSAKAQQRADEQIEDVKAHYAILNKEGENGDLTALASRYSDAERGAIESVSEAIIQREGYRSYDKVPNVETVIVEEEMTVTEAIMQAAAPRERNVFESDQPDTYFDFDEELKRREEHPNDPFVITREEFNNNEADYEQGQLTYYDGDGVLTDDHDKPVDNSDSVVGDENMLRFGHGSGDPKIVYIRCPKLEIDFEVSHSEGSFAKEVLGFDEELQHSDRRPPRRFRQTDD